MLFMNVERVSLGETKLRSGYTSLQLFFGHLPLFERHVHDQPEPGSFFPHSLREGRQKTLGMSLLKGDYNFKLALYNNLYLKALYNYHMYINIFFFCWQMLANQNTWKKVNDKTLQSQTTYQRLFRKLNVVAMATTDRDAWLDL